MKTFKSVPAFAALALFTAGSPATAQENDFVFYSELARAWYEAGSYFEWQSTTENNNGAVVDVHYRTFGDPEDPQLLLVHGYPRSSFDYEEMIVYLQDDYYIATLDFPGFGFSEKPLNDYSYMLEDDARLLDFFVREIVEFDDFAMFTHDRGVSVGLAFLGHYLDEDRPYTINYHFLSNSGMFLPLANLVPGQRVLLDPVRGPAAIAELNSRPRQTE
ncbi:MAG: alpha/beta fold hydrolase, partial [Gammaproteobacteria bacterium]|nr:alpha/beta fold hydrolase [Gammaproteobacteria bacterium]